MNELENFKELLTLRNFSNSTISGYASYVNIVSESFGKLPSEITENDLRAYIVKRKELSSSTRMAIINSFKSFYSLCLNRKFDHSILPRPKVEQKQPDILSLEEFQKMVDTIMNLKHKTIVCLMYSCGLRVSEAINLKIKDIDSSLMQITIKNGKGKIDRIVMLDKSILKLLRDYAVEYRIKLYLFEGAKGDKYSETSIQNIVKKAVREAGIKKRISTHSLRHSCFTQLIKNGVDLRTIQKIAGHKNINTTANYIKLSDEDVTGTISPISRIKI